MRKLVPLPMEKQMQIIETITINRANTDVAWPLKNSVVDPNDPWPTANVSITSAMSDDNLTTTTIRTWASKEEFLTLHSYVSPNFSGNNYFNSIIIPGLTHTRTILITE
jgi:hypothetical protein